MKKTAQIISYAMILYLGSSLVVQLVLMVAAELGGMIYAMAAGGDIMSGAMVVTNSWFLMITSIISSYIVAPFCAWLLIKRLPSAEIKRSRPSVKNVLMSGCVCLGTLYLFGYLSEGILWITAKLFDTTTAKLNAVNQLSEQFGILQYVLLVCVCAPIAEEVFFRGLVINKMLVYGKTAAIVLSAAIFGLVHGTLSQIPYALALGLVLGYIYIRFGNIYLNIGLHAVMNFMGGVFYLIIEDIPYAEYINTGIWAVFCIAAAVIVVVNRKVIKNYILENGGGAEPAGVQARTVLCNAGFIVFAVLCVLLMLFSLASAVFMST